MTTGIQANGTDLDTLLAPRRTTKIADVNIDSNGGVDISNRFETLDTGTAPAVTNIKKNTNTDLNELFAAIGTTDISVSPNTNGVTTDSSDNPVHAGIDYRTNGTEWSSTAAGSYTVPRGNWLDTGLSSEAWVQRVISVGSLDIDPGAGRLQLNTARLFEVQDPSLAGGPVTCTLTFNFYDHATLGSLIGTTGSIVLSANRGV